MGVDATIDRIDTTGAHPWPAGLALADAVLRGATPFAHDILDLGCGCGVVALAAALAQPTARIVAVDNEPAALATTRANAERNGLAERIAIERVDWREPATARHELILAADCCYLPDSARPLIAFIAAALAPGGRAVIADPDRWTARHLDLVAREAGFAVATRVWPVPFVAEHGPVRAIDPAIRGAISVTLFELTRAATS